MENFIEYSLPYRLTPMDHFKRMGYTIGLMLAGVLAIMYLGVIGILLCAGICYVSYRVFLSFNYEWEYTLLEDEINFTKIINKERRREFLKASIAKTESYGPIANRPASNCKVRSFLTNQGEEPEYFWITYNAKGEKVCILFQPTPAVLDVFRVKARGKLR